MKFTNMIIVFLALLPINIQAQTFENDALHVMMEDRALVEEELRVITNPNQSNSVIVETSLMVDPMCSEVHFDVHSEDANLHYIDYYLDDSLYECDGALTEKRTNIVFDRLVPGIHTISVMGPQGNDVVLRFEINKLGKLVYLD